MFLKRKEKLYFHLLSIYTLYGHTLTADLYDAVHSTAQ